VQLSLQDMFETQFIRASSVIEQHLLSKEETHDEVKVAPVIARYNAQLTPDIMYSLNRHRFYQQERNELIIDLVGSLHSHPYARNIVRCIIRLAEMKPGDDFMEMSPPIRQDEIVPMVDKDLKLSRADTLECLKTLVFVPRNTTYRPEDDVLVIKRDPFSPDSYTLDYLLATKQWLRRTALRYATERHGIHAACALGMLLSHGPSEMDLIQKETLICPKEAKNVIYTLENDSFVERRETLSGSDFNRAEPKYATSFLHLARLLEARWEQAIFNVLVQRKALADDNRVLLNKYKTLDKFARTLEEPDEVADLWGSLTRPERQTLSVLRQQMLQTGVQQQGLCRELIMIKYAVQMFVRKA